MREQTWRELDKDDRIAVVIGEAMLKAVDAEVKRDDAERNADRYEKSWSGAVTVLAEAHKRIAMLEKANQDLIDKMPADVDPDSPEGKRGE